MDKINVLGTEYTIIYKNSKDDSYLEECGGYIDSSVKLIIIDDMEACKDEALCKSDLKYVQKHSVRHEIIHAFLFESGLDGCSGGVSNWAANEEMVDFFAHQWQKINKAFESAGV